MRGFLTSMIAFAASAFCAANADCSELYGTKLVADDGTYLGEIESAYDSGSIFNNYGEYGSAYSSDSIFNKFGEYGSEYSSKSAFNPYTSTPPMLISEGKVVGYLTTNQYLSGAVNPYALIAECSG